VGVDATSLQPTRPVSSLTLNSRISAEVSVIQATLTGLVDGNRTITGVTERRRNGGLRKNIRASPMGRKAILISIDAAMPTGHPSDHNTAFAQGRDETQNSTKATKRQSDRDPAVWAMARP